MITAAIREAFEELVTRTIDLPWKAPDGSTWQAEIYSHSRTEYRNALEGAGISPRGGLDRSKRLLVQSQIDPGKASDAMDSSLWLLKYPLEFGVAYSREETILAMELVRDHLVKSIFRVEPLPMDAQKGKAPTKKKLPKKDVAAWFASTEEIPTSIPSAASDDKMEEVPWGGEQENVALATEILVESVQTGEFLRRLVPLSTTPATLPGQVVGIKPKLEASGQ